MRDLNLNIPVPGQKVSNRFLTRLAGNAANVPAQDVGIVGTTLSATAPQEPVEEVVPATLTADLLSGSSAEATFLVGADRDQTGATFVVYDLPAFISSGYKIENGVKIRVQFDSVAGKWVMREPAACEVAV